MMMDDDEGCLDIPGKCDAAGDIQACVFNTTHVCKDTRQLAAVVEFIVPRLVPLDRGPYVVQYADKRRRRRVGVFFIVAPCAATAAILLFLVVKRRPSRQQVEDDFVTLPEDPLETADHVEIVQRYERAASSPTAATSAVDDDDDETKSSTKAADATLV